MRSQLPLKPLEFLVLAVLEEGPLHGYGIAQRIEARTDGILKVRPGDLYRVLYRMRRRQLLDNAARPVSREGGDERRTYYALSRFGREVLEAEARMLSSVVSSVGKRKNASPA